MRVPYFREWRSSAAAGAGVPLDITVHDASVLNPLFGTDPLRVTALGVSQAPWNSHRTIDSVMTTIEYAAGERCPEAWADPRRVRCSLPGNQHGGARRKGAPSWC